MNILKADLECDCGSRSFDMPVEAGGQVICSECGEKLGTVAEINARMTKAAVLKSAKATLNSLIRKENAKRKG